MQFWIFAIAFVSLVVFVIFKTDFLSGVWSKGVIENPKMAISSCFKDYHAMIFALGILIKTLYPKLNGSRYQKMMMCNDAKKIKKSLLCSAGVVAFFTFFSICFGLLVYSNNPNLKIPEIIPFFVNNYCPTGLKGLLGAGVFVMCISTAESIWNSNAVVFTNDIIPAFYKIFSKKTYVPSVFVARLSTILLSCLGVYISFHMTYIFSILMTFGNFYYPVAIIPSIMLVLGFNFKKASVMCGVWGGILATFINYVITKDLSSYFLGMMANLAGLLLTELFIRMKKKNEELLLLNKQHNLFTRLLI